MKKAIPTFIFLTVIITVCVFFFFDSKPRSAEELKTAIEEAHRTKDIEAMMALVYPDKLSKESRESKRKRLEYYFGLDEGWTRKPASLSPLHQSYKPGRIRFGHRIEPNITPLGFIDIVYEEADKKNSSTPRHMYGKKDNAYYIVGHTYTNLDWHGPRDHTLWFYIKQSDRNSTLKEFKARLIWNASGVTIDEIRYLKPSTSYNFSGQYWDRIELLEAQHHRGIELEIREGGQDIAELTFAPSKPVIYNRKK